MDPTDSYLIFADMAGAQSRSNQLARSVHCDNVNTLYWHQQVQLTDGRAVLVIKESGPYSHKIGPSALQQLTPNEIASLVPFSAISSVWPPPILIGA